MGLGGSLKKTWNRVKNETSDVWRQVEENRRDLTSQAREGTKAGIAAVSDDNTADWLSAFVSGLSTSAANAVTAGAYSLANGGIGDQAYLGQWAESLLDAGTAGALSAYSASVTPGKEREARKAEAANAPPDIRMDNDPNTSAQFNRLRKAARSLGRAGTFKNKGTNTSLGLGDSVLGDQLSLIGS